MLALSTVTMGSVNLNYIDSRKEQHTGRVSQTTSIVFLRPNILRVEGDPQPPSLTTCPQERPNLGLKDHRLTLCAMGQDQESQKQSSVPRGHPRTVLLSRKNTVKCLGKLSEDTPRPGLPI